MGTTVTKRTSRKEASTPQPPAVTQRSVECQADLAAERFAVLVRGDELGASIRALAPPVR